MDAQQLAVYIGYAVALIATIGGSYIGVIPKDVATATFTLIVGTFLTLHVVTPSQVKAIQAPLVASLDTSVPAPITVPLTVDGHPITHMETLTP